MRIRRVGVCVAAAVLACVPAALVAQTAGQAAPTLSPLISVSPTEFLKLPEAVQAIYVGGVLDGVTYTSYGYGLPDHDAYIRCVRTLTLGNLAQRVAARVRAAPMAAENTPTYVAQALGAYCKEKGMR
jgi:hypothetical protein